MEAGLLVACTSTSWRQIEFMASCHAHCMLWVYTKMNLIFKRSSLRRVFSSFIIQQHAVYLMYANSHTGSAAPHVVIDWNKQEQGFKLRKEISWLCISLLICMYIWMTYLDNFLFILSLLIIVFSSFSSFPTSRFALDIKREKLGPNLGDLLHRKWW